MSLNRSTNSKVKMTKVGHEKGESSISVQDIQWCHNCESSFPQSCELHGEMNIIQDSTIPVKALYTLPCQLYVKLGGQNRKSSGVFAKEDIEARTQFGPVDAAIDWGPCHAKSDSFELKVEENGDLVNLDLKNEEECNWMMYIRPATSSLHQNLIVINQGNSIYYVSNKRIEKDTELRIWYGEKYAERIGKNYLIKRTKKVYGFEEWDILNSIIDYERAYGGTQVSIPSDHVKNDDDDDNLPDNVNENNLLAIHELDRDQVEPDPDYEPSKKPSFKRRRSARITLKNYKSKSKKKTTKKTKDVKVKASKSTNGKIKQVKTQKPPRYICRICDEGFTREANFQTHIATHTGTLPFICNVQGCNKGFKNKFLYLRHQNIHQNGHMQSCLYCDRKFRRKDHLKNHMLVHDLNRNIWKCEQCNKIYMRHERYKFHLAMHHAKEKEPPHCVFCEKDFESKETVISHLNSVHSRYKSTCGKERQIKCDVCHKMFLTNKDVQRHMVTHTQKKEFLCEICSQVFGRKDHLTRHVKNAHPDGLMKKTKLKEVVLDKRNNDAEKVTESNESVNFVQNVNVPIAIIPNTEPLLISNPNEGSHQGRFIPPSYEDVNRKPDDISPNNFIPSVNLTSTHGLVTLLDLGAGQSVHNLSLTQTDSPSNNFLHSQPAHNSYISISDHSYMINPQRPNGSDSNSVPLQTKTVGELLWDSEELRKREYETASYLQSFASGCTLSVPSTNSTDHTTLSVSIPQTSQLSWDTVLSYAKQFTNNSSS